MSCIFKFYFLLLIIIYIKKSICTVNVNENVNILTNANFTIKIDEENYFVMFWAPWCRASRSLVPKWNNLANFIVNRESNNLVKIGSVDCNLYSHICDINNIEWLPTIKYFNVTSNESKSFPYKPYTNRKLFNLLNTTLDGTL